MTERKGAGSAQDPAVADPQEEQEARVAEARLEVEGRIAEADAMHLEDERRGAEQAPHQQESGVDVPTDVLHSDVSGVGTRVVERDEQVRDVGQQALGMGPLSVHRGVQRGSVLQPVARVLSAYTVPSTRPDGSAYVFTNPSSGTAMGAQAVKTSGAHSQLVGGRWGATVVFADLIAGFADRLPTFSDRHLQEPDLPAYNSLVVIQASNPQR